MGAVYTAGLAVCFWSDLDELCTNWAEGHPWRPAMAPPIGEKAIEAGEWPRKGPLTGCLNGDFKQCLLSDILNPAWCQNNSAKKSPVSKIDQISLD